MLKLNLHTQQDIDHITMALIFNNAHIIYYHMDVTWSMGLVQTYFTHPDYFVVQCWVCVTYLFPDTVSQMGPIGISIVMLSSSQGVWVTCHLAPHVTA